VANDIRRRAEELMRAQRENAARERERIDPDGAAAATQRKQAAEVAALCRQFHSWAVRHGVPAQGLIDWRTRGWCVAGYVTESNGSDWRGSHKLHLWVSTSGELRVHGTGTPRSQPATAEHLGKFRQAIDDGIARHVVRSGHPWDS
jgi:hypothetical protein